MNLGINLGIIGFRAIQSLVNQVLTWNTSTEIFNVSTIKWDDN